MKRQGPANPYLFYCLLFILLVQAGVFIVKYTFKTVEIKDGEIACSSKEVLEPGSHWMLEDTEFYKIETSGVLTFDTPITDHYGYGRKEKSRKVTVDDIGYHLNTRFAKQFCMEEQTNETINKKLNGLVF